jgi:hypothetical protein
MDLQISLQLETELAGKIAAFDTATDDFLKQGTSLFMKGWELGKQLCHVKEEIGHGDWLLWLESRFPNLSRRNYQRCMVFYKDNPNCTNSCNAIVDPRLFTQDSIRKFMWGYVPTKERNLIEDGSRPIENHYHPLDFRNQLFKWDQQVKKGLQDPPEPELFRKDMRPTLKLLGEIGGVDWVKETFALS